MRPARDTELVQIVDAALADATARGSDWLACRPGCTQCCHGVFAINQLDAERLRDGLTQLALDDPMRAAAVRARAEEAVARLSIDFPGDPVTGILGTSDEEEDAFAEFANDEPCPVLSPETGTCDLYEARPLTCRVFGPPVLSEEGLGMCELCYQGASEAEIAAGEMHLTHHALEEKVNEEAERATRQTGSTLIAFVLGLPRT